MSQRKPAAALLGAVLVLAGCSGMPFPAGEPTAATADRESSGTAFGETVARMRGELAALERAVAELEDDFRRLRERGREHVRIYRDSVAAAGAPSGAETAPGGPAARQQWAWTQMRLNQVGADVAELAGLANRAAGEATRAAYLLDVARAADGLPGAVAEDRRALATFDDDARGAAVLANRLLAEIGREVARRSDYVAEEWRTSMQVLAAAGRDSASREAAGIGTEPDRPLVIIRFDRPEVDYEQPLHAAIARALEQAPDISFEVAAVVPPGAAAAGRRDAERVLRSLTGMGLPPERIRRSTRTAAETASNEVHIFIR